ncbi:MAG: hypothetical protein AMXMBFR25_00270 [Lysobacterales bacterium]|nr:Ribonuclease HII [Xanthomonadales bacterium]
MSLVAGVDEAGRGPLAGPLVVAAVILDPARPIAGLADSKVLAAERREVLAPLIRQRALAWSLVVVEVAEIDRLNIFHATMTGMTRSVNGLSTTPVEVLVDGNKLPKDLHLPARAIIKGDAKEPCISAASILAKTHRDALMRELDVRWPVYGFVRHYGYPTPEHLARLREHGPCPIHRRSFAPVRTLLRGSLR